jgi:putative ABC transport system permease protein
MRFHTLVFKELWERPVPMLTCLLAVVLGITALVAIQTITTHSELAVARELDALGANVLILPKGVTLQDYYAADLHGKTLPEELVDRITLSKLEGVDNLSPKLCVPATLYGQPVTLTGILPKSEFQAKAAWGGAGIFARPIGCGAKIDTPTSEPADPKALARKRVIENLDEHEVLVGSDVAARAGLKEGKAIELLGGKFTVLAVLPETGTVDDARVFAHLHTVQSLAGKGEVVNVIEVVGCCKQIATGLVDGLNELLPDVKIVTITQVVQTQQNVNRLMERLSLIFLILLLAVGGSTIAGTLYANVSERRKEIGTLMALGATPSLVLRLIVGKAVILGLAGGIVGYGIGSLAAWWMGPQLASVAVHPMPAFAALAIAVALAVTLLGSLLPAWRAARLDPCVCFREV